MEFIDLWRELSTEDRQKLADESETSVKYLTQIAYQHRKAGWELAIRIENAPTNNGRVTRKRLRPDIFH